MSENKNQEIPKSEKLWYLGSIFSKDYEIVDNITHRIKVAWLKWRATSGVLCNRKVPPKLKFYRTTIRPAILYGNRMLGNQETTSDKNECS